VLGVYTGTSVGGLTERASNDDGGEGGTSLVRLSVTAGTAYQIAVDGYRAGGGSIRLTVTLTNHTIVLSASPSTGGAAIGAGTYAAGSSRTVSATARDGYIFINWTENGNVANSSADYTFTLNDNRTLIANFKTSPTALDTYEITKLDVVRGELTFTEVSGALSYRVEWSKTLVPESWRSESPGVPRIEAIGAGERTVKIGTITPPCYYRVVAERAPQGFVLIPAGPFQMGDTFREGWGQELPVHAVNVSAFFLQTRETTKEEWDAVLTWALANGYTFDNAGRGKAANHPVGEINWYDVVKWCNARSEKEGLVPCYYTDAARTQVYKTKQVDVTNDQVLWTANGYRLPTEAEWEKAARGGLAAMRFPWGDTISHSQANYWSFSDNAYDISPTRERHPIYDDFPYTSPVGSFAAYGYGLYDMAGNADEWCWDLDGPYDTGSPSNPRGASSGDSRVLRSGQTDCRVAYRSANSPFSSVNSGFRVARSSVP
jgi:sulfatase modifying factor 1